MIEVTRHPIDRDAVRLAVEDPRYGALLTFDGVTRNHHDGRPVLRLEYEAYEPMAIAQMREIAEEAQQRWACTVAMVHRIGVVPLGEASVVICVGAPHRAACYEASRYAIDELKMRVPIWKKEIYTDGSAWKANAPAEE